MVLQTTKENKYTMISRHDMEDLGYFAVAFPTAEPTWFTPNRVVKRARAFNLRCFRAGSGESTLIVPPQAGHSSTIADYDDRQSLVQTVLANTNGPVYCIEWLSATQGRKGENVDSLIDQLKLCIDCIGPAHLIGLCQGGWLSTMFTARYPKDILSLTPIAAPIDFHKGGGIIFDTITKHGMKPYKKVVDDNDGIMSGKMMLLGWKMMHPMERFCGDYVDIYTDILLGNTKKLAKVKKFRTWYEWTQDLAGTWYLQACEDLFLNNLLVKGKFQVHGEYVDLSKITCPVVMVAGGDDDITLESHLFALGDYVQGTVVEITIPKCGHIGCFMGSKSQSYIADAIRYTRR